jgi:hypothetical protein
MTRKRDEIREQRIAMEAVVDASIPANVRLYWVDRGYEL